MIIIYIYIYIFIYLFIYVRFPIYLDIIKQKHKNVIPIWDPPISLISLNKNTKIWFQYAFGFHQIASQYIDLIFPHLSSVPPRLSSQPGSRRVSCGVVRGVAERRIFVALEAHAHWRSAGCDVKTVKVHQMIWDIIAMDYIALHDFAIGLMYGYVMLCHVI